MSEVTKTKEQLLPEFDRIKELGKVLGGKLDAAKASGNNQEYQSLSQDLLRLKTIENDLQNQWSSITEQEKQPELERLKQTREELSQPITTPSANYLSMYGMGGIGGNPPLFNTQQPSVEEQVARKRELIGERLNKPLQGSMEAERLPSFLIAKMATLPDPTSKADILKKEFPNANIMPLDVGGDTEFLISLPDGSTKTTLQKGAAGLAGVAPEALVTAAETGSFIGTLGATRSPAVATGISSLVGGAVGTGIDEGLRYAYGLDSDLGNTLTRRGVGALAGMALGGVTDVAIPAMRASRIESPFENQFVKTLETAQEDLMKRETKLAASQNRPVGEIQVPSGARLAGPQGMETQSELAGTYPSSNIAGSARRTQETIRRLLDDYKSKIPANASNFADIAAQKQAQKSALAEQIAVTTGRNKRIVEAALDRQTIGAKSDTDELGDILLNSLKSAEDEAIRVRDTQYQALNEIADTAGFSVSPSELLGEIGKIKSEINPGGAFDTSAVRAVEERLKKRMEAVDRPLTFNEFDDYIKAFTDARPENAVGGTTKDVFGARFSEKLSSLRRDVYSKFDAPAPDGTMRNLGDEFEKATQLVKERGAYEKNLLGGILKEAAGEQSRTPRDIVSAVIKEPATIDRVARSLRELGASDPTKAGEADRVLGLLQTEYMNRIGIKPSLQGRGARFIEADPATVRSLFGDKADAQLRSIADLNRDLRKIGRLDKVDLTLNEINAMGQALSEKERKELTKGIVKRIQLQNEEDALTRSAIFDLAKKGDFKNIDADSISNAILSNNTTIDETQRVLTQLSKSSLKARNLYKGDFRRALLDKYAGGKPSANAPFAAFFDTERFIKDYRPSTGDTRYARKIQSVLGKEEADFLYNLAVTAESNAIADVKKGGATLRTVGSPQGVTVVLPLQQLATSARNRLLTAALSTGMNNSTLVKALARNALPGDVNKVYTQLARQMFLTRQGVEALAHQASSDPEFSAELIKMAKDFEEKEGLNMQEK